jgi:hypothetical protein
MSLLMIRCPRTGQEVSTGLETDPDSFQTIPDVLDYTPCPHCGIDHAWWPDEAWLADGPSSRQELSMGARANATAAIAELRKPQSERTDRREIESSSGENLLAGC